MEREEAFKKAKQALANATMLAYPRPGSHLLLTTDASDAAVGAVLEQSTPSGPQPLAFFSKKLTTTQAKYSTFDRELLAIYLATRHFKHLLEPVTFTVNTDHLPLVHAFSKKSDPTSSRQQRHLSTIAEFNCIFQHVPGTSNDVADALSRNCIVLADSGIDLHDLTQQQAEAEEPTQNSSSL